MNGKVFEKVGVNVSTVGGRFSEEFASSIPGAEDDPSFFATGISLVAHMANPHVPAVHMNTRFLTTTRRWFGGGADLNPAIPYEEDTDAFHARLRAACAAHDPTFYPRFSKWAEEYFWLPHRGQARGVGGIFYDRLECAAPGHGATFDEHFAFTRDVGEAFLDIFPQIVRRRTATPFDAVDMDRLLTFRGRYVEFNLLYDRGTLFGLKTGGNIDAILMSLPPLAKWARSVGAAGDADWVRGGGLGVEPRQHHSQHHRHHRRAEFGEAGADQCRQGEWLDVAEQQPRQEAAERGDRQQEDAGGDAE
jgi:coproporphyrinogen III oxidase